MKSTTKFCSFCLLKVSLIHSFSLPVTSTLVQGSHSLPRLMYFSWYPYLLSFSPPTYHIQKTQIWLCNPLLQYFQGHCLLDLTSNDFITPLWSCPPLSAFLSCKPLSGILQSSLNFSPFWSMSYSVTHKRPSHMLIPPMDTFLLPLINLFDLWVPWFSLTHTLACAHTTNIYTVLQDREGTSVQAPSATSTTQLPILCF